MMIKKYGRLTVVGAGIFLVAACGGPTIKQEVELPARESGMVNSKKLAVFNIDGDHDSSFTRQVESYMANIKVRGKPYFEVLERQMLSKIIAEQKMVAGSGMFNEKDAVKLGNLAGADTLIMGGVRIPAVSVRRYYKPEQTCRAYNAKKECVTTETIHRSCIEKLANVDFTLKAVSVQKGSIVFTKSYSGKAGNDYCDGSFGSNKSEADLRNDAIGQTLAALRKDVAPYTEIMSVEFMEKDDVMTSATKAKVKSALEFVEQKRIDRACEIFKEALAGDTNSPAVNYNLGVCAEVGGDLERAGSLYGQAERKSAKPVKLISEAIVRIKNLKSNKEAVGSQLR